MLFQLQLLPGISVFLLFELGLPLAKVDLLALDAAHDVFKLELLNDPTDAWVLHKVLHIRPLGLVNAHHALDHLEEVVRVLARNALKFARLDFHGQLDLIRSFEWGSKCREFIEDTACRPNIALFVVFLVLNLFRGHVVRGAHMSICENGFISHESRKSKVTQLHVPASIEKHITRLEIPMEHTATLLLAMAGVKRRGDLSDDLPNFVLRDVLLVPFELLDELSHVPALAVLHYDEDLGLLLINNAIVVPDNVRVVELPQDVDLRDQLLLLFLIHLAIVELLPNKYAPVCLPLDLADDPEAALADVSQLVVVLHF